MKPTYGGLLHTVILRHHTTFSNLSQAHHCFPMGKQHILARLRPATPTPRPLDPHANHLAPHHCPTTADPRLRPASHTPHHRLRPNAHSTPSSPYPTHTRPHAPPQPHKAMLDPPQPHTPCSTHSRHSLDTDDLGCF